jgi:hypothetical protein
MNRLSGLEMLCQFGAKRSPSIDGGFFSQSKMSRDGVEHTIFGGLP